MAFRVLVYPSHMRLYMDKSYDKIDSWGLEANAAVKTALGMKNNCYINVKMLFENVRVHVSVRPYLPFSTTRHCAACDIAIFALWFKQKIITFQLYCEHNTTAPYPLKWLLL